MCVRMRVRVHVRVRVCAFVSVYLCLCVYVMANGANRRVNVISECRRKTFCTITNISTTHPIRHAQENTMSARAMICRAHGKKAYLKSDAIKLSTNGSGTSHNWSSCASDDLFREDARRRRWNHQRSPELLPYHQRPITQCMHSTRVA